MERHTLGGVMVRGRRLLAMNMFLRGDVFAVEHLRGSDSRVAVGQSIEQTPVLDAEGSQMLLVEGKSKYTHVGDSCTSADSRQTTIHVGEDNTRGNVYHSFYVSNDLSTLLYFSARTTPF